MTRVKKHFRKVGAAALLAAIAFAACGVNARAQGSRKDDIVFNAQGRPMAGATVRVCTSAATGQPCTPLALIYSDPGLTQALANPIATDGLGNYTFYAAPGRYEIEISGPSITTKQIPNVILPNDPSSPTFTTVTTTSGISAFSLSLTGNLTVSGSTAVAGTLTVGGAPVPSTNQDNQWTAAQRFKGPDPWRDFTAYMPAGGCSSTDTSNAADTTGTISLSAPTTLTLAAAVDFKTGCGIAVLGAGPAATLNTPPSTVSVSTASRSGGNTVTIATSANHGLVVGSGNGTNQGVVVSSCSVSAYNGTFPLQSIADATHFTYTAGSGGTDTATGCVINLTFGYAHGTTGSTTYHYKIASVDANMGVSPASTTAITIANGSATLTKYNYNHIMWPQVAGAYEFIVYSDLGLGGAYSCVGTAFTNGYSDRGLGMPCPAFAPATPPATAQPQTLSTTIAAGGGTTTLTLAASASTAVTSQNVYHDESSFLTSCVNDVITAISANPGSNEYGCYIPAGNWWFNGMLPTGNVSNNNHSVKIWVAGKTQFHTIPWFISQQGYAVLGVGAGPSFASFQSKAAVSINLASSLAAGVVVNGTSIEVSGFIISSYGHGIYVVGGGALTFDNDSMGGNGTAGSPITFDNSILGVHMNHDVLIAQGGAGDQAAMTFSQTPYSSNSTCCVYVNDLVTYNHSLEFSSPGGNGSSAGDNSIFLSNWLQENLAPADGGDIIYDYGPNASGALIPGEAITDLRIDNLNDSDTSGNSVLVATGSAWNVSSVSLLNINGPATILQCVNILTVCNGTQGIVGFFSVNGPTNPGALGMSGNGFEVDSNYGNLSRNRFYFADTSEGAGYPAWAMLLPPVLTFSVTGTASSGGTLSAGVYCADVTGVDARGQETLPTPIVCQSVSTNGTISYQWFENNFFAYTSFNFYECLIASGTCTPNKQITGITGTPDPISYTFTTPSVTTALPPVQSQAYLSWMSWDFNDTRPSCFYCSTSHSDQWPIGFGTIPTQNLGINLFTKLGIRAGTQFQAAETTAPSGVASIDQLWADSAAHQWKKIENNGTAFIVPGVLTGTTGSIGGSALTAGQCASGTVSVTGSTTSMTTSVSPNTYPGDGFIPWGYVSANGTVTVKVCAQASGTPTSSTYNVRVIQ